MANLAEGVTAALSERDEPFGDYTGADGKKPADDDLNQVCDEALEN